MDLRDPDGREQTRLAQFVRKEEVVDGRQGPGAHFRGLGLVAWQPLGIEVPRQHGMDREPHVRRGDAQLPQVLDTACPEAGFFLEFAVGGFLEGLARSADRAFRETQFVLVQAGQVLAHQHDLVVRGDGDDDDGLSAPGRQALVTALHAVREAQVQGLDVEEPALGDAGRLQDLGEGHGSDYRP